MTDSPTGGGRTYDDFVELAKLCAHHARSTLNRPTAGEFWKMAYEYLDRAVALNSSRSPTLVPFGRNLAEALSLEREQRIRILAYALWERQGRPEGQALRHWLTAETAIEWVEGSLMKRFAKGELTRH